MSNPAELVGETCSCGTPLKPDPAPYRGWCPKCRMQVRTLAR